MNTQKSVIYRSVSFDENVLSNILKDLYSQNIGILLVEGGAQLLNTFIEKGLWDEARVFKTRKTLISKNGIRAPKIIDAQLEKKIQLFDNQLLIFRPT
jgi:diaminohydroxyphosphoribosylaminopyrimidine deaminase/5-amino-6-(5-phosphoribosylamino)uracil reductase